MRDDQLLHPDTELVIRGYLPGAENQITAVLERTRAAISLWNITDPVALSGGTRSVVVAGAADGVRVVLKVPLIGDPLSEARILSVLPRGPAVLDVVETALLLEYIDGQAVSSSDGVRVAAALEAIAPMRSADPAGFVPWRTYLYARIEEFAGNLIEHSTNAEFVALAHQVLSDLAELAAPQPVVAAHGDLQGKNLLATNAGVRVLDPLGILAPSAWEGAFSVMSVVANGGDPTPVLEAARHLGVGEMGEWLRVAAVAIAGSLEKANDPESCARVLANLG